MQHRTTLIAPTLLALAAALLAVLAVPSRAADARILMPAVADTWAFVDLLPPDRRAPAVPHDDDVDLVTGVHDAVGTWTALVRFELPPVLAPGVRIRTSRLRLYARSATSVDPRQGALSSAYAITGPWLDVGLVPNALPATGPKLSEALPQPQAWVEFEVTSVVQAWVDGGENHGLAVRTTTWPESRVVFSSREGDHPPRLIVEYGALATEVFTPVPALTTATPGPTRPADASFTIDTTADRRPISPDIYGMNFADPALMRELGMTVRRWGGNATTRYNYLDDTSNRGSDWFFETLPEDNDDRARLPGGSAADRFVAEGRAAGTNTVLTVPLIGWTAKAGGRFCSFSVAKYGPQEKTDQWWPDCGNGRRSGGSPITGNDPADASTATDPTFVKGWVTHLVDAFGDASQGGVKYYNLDNEPMLWHETHRDVFPRGLDYDGLRDRTLAYAAAVKDADPTAKTLGPAEWGWTGYFWSARDAEGGGDWWNRAPDRRAHGDVPLAAWYLAQLRDAERSSGRRLLDYFDLHYYPQADGVALAPAGDAATQARRLRSTRSLWDPTYHDESWIDEPVRLIPRMRDWVAANYPGTKIAIGEYNWGALDDLNGALAQADVLGIFGREGVDLATLWDPMKADEPGAFAFRAFRNYDGQGGRFGETAVRVAGGTAERDVAVYAAERATDGALTVVAVNKTTEGVDTLACLANFVPRSPVRAFRYDASLPASIRRLPDTGPVWDLCGPDLDGVALRLDLPAMSITILEALPDRSVPPFETPRLPVYLPFARQ